ncbi:hypothetical protein [Fundidesulfovibrio putealis]|uniref:hypothetical protein n=1 Tax=Fundidesulfovibrio putealis TaxID=270496 RepID=UPI0004800E3B|nr:hypothetical protein [Fundidesulfovibrio putealis]
MGAEVGWHLRFVQAGVVDIWADPGQAALFEELAATFGQWRMEREDVDGVMRFRFVRRSSGG